MFRWIIAVILLLTSVSAHAVIIDFVHDLAGASAPIIEDGFTVDANSGANGVFDNTFPIITNGTQIFGWCANACGGLQTILITKNVPAPFSLTAIDAANLVPGVIQPGQTIDIVGNVSGGGTVSTSFTLVPNAYTTFILAGFINLTSVEITSNPTDCQFDGPAGPLGCDIGIDNIVIDQAPPTPIAPSTPIPTMSVWGLGTLIALMGFIGFIRRRKM